MTWKTSVPTQNQFRRIFFFWRLSPREQSRGNIARAIVYLTNPGDSFDRRAKESRNTQQASCTYAGWLACNPPPPSAPFFSFFIIYPSRKKHPRFTVFTFGGLHSNVMKTRRRRRRGGSQHAHNILRINWPVLPSCRNDGNAKAYVYTIL